MKTVLAEANDNLVRAERAAYRAHNALRSGGADNLMVAMASAEIAHSRAQSAYFTLKREVADSCF